MHHAVLAKWHNGEAVYSHGIRALLDGRLVDELTGDLESAVFNMVLPGPHTFEVQGDCGDDGPSTTAKASLEVLTETPHPHPTAGPISCEWTEDDGGTLTATWTNADPSEFIDVFVFDGFDYFLVDTIDGFHEMVAVYPLDSTTTIRLQFFARREGGCYGSNLVGCEDPQPGFVRGDVDASGEINITDAIGLLGYLFQGFDAPPCMDSADSDDSGDGAPNITDAIYLLAWLFQGGPPPVTPSPSVLDYPVEDCGPDPTPDDDVDCLSFPSCFAPVP